MVKLIITIDDQKWPHLKASFERHNLDGTKTGSMDQAQYDNAYAVFENAVHNHLRPMVAQLNERRLRK